VSLGGAAGAGSGSSSGGPGGDCRLIVAMTPERLIGRGNALPWHLPEDLAHFKRCTRGGTIIMGRRSFESIGGRPLPQRCNLVVSASLAADAGPDGRAVDGVRAFDSLPAACAWVLRTRPTGGQPPWILGGSRLFEQVLSTLDGSRSATPKGSRLAAPAGTEALPLPRPVELVVTWVPSQPLLPGDVLFPFDRAWIELHYEVVARRAGESGGLEFVTYRLRPPASAASGSPAGGRRWP